MTPKESFFDRAKAQVELQIKQAEDERRKEMLRKRVEFVSNGIKCYRAKKIADAATHFHSYIKVLEDAKGVGPGGLTPQAFDLTRELGDWLMLIAVYWDLTTLYDRTRSEEKRQEFRHYLEKFVLFSKGTNSQPICAEYIRRYLTYGRPTHRLELKNAYKLLADGRCFIATELIGETRLPTLPILRRFRDEVLKKSPAGRAFIRIYYGIGPVLALLLRKSPTFIRKRIANALDWIAARIWASAQWRIFPIREGRK